MSIDTKIQFPTDSQPEPVQISKNTANSSTGAAKPAGVSPAGGEDTVSISSKHTEVQTLATSLKAVPEVRTARVDSLKAQVQKGQYQPASQHVADAILKEHGKVNARA